MRCKEGFLIEIFRRSTLGSISISVIFLIGFLALLGYVVSPDATTNANQMHLTIPNKPMGYRVSLLRIPLDKSLDKNWFAEIFTGRDVTHEETPILQYIVLQNDDKEVFQITYTDLSTEEKTYTISKAKGNSIKEIEDQYIESRTFWLGTDKYGRDFLSRLIIGARISFLVGFIAVVISLLVGVLLGALAGYFGGNIDKLIMWLINVVWSVPTLLLVIAIIFAIGKGYWQIFIAVGLTMWVEVARITRGQFMELKQQEFVEAAKALGFSNYRIIFNHILPNAWGPIIVICTANFASAILVESGLSFLGIGAQPPTPSWGSIIKEHYSQIVLGYAYLAVIPGLCIMTLVLAFMILGNWLRDYLDVKN